MPSHFNCIGFPVEDMEAYWTLARRAAAEGVSHPAPGGSAVVRWAPQLHPLPSPAPGGAEGGRTHPRLSSIGPEIWVQIDRTGEVGGATPFFATGAAHRIAITGIGEDPEEPLDGWVDGWLEPVEDDEPYSGAFPLRVNLVDFALVRDRMTTFPAPGRLEIAALAHEAELFENEAAYRAAPGEIYRPPVESFASAAHAGIDETLGFQEATALITGRIVHARLLINPVTESPYWWMQVGVHGVTLQVFGDRETLGRDPREGYILSGGVWLIGRMA